MVLDTHALVWWVAEPALLPEIRFVPISVEIAGRAGSLGAETPGDPMDRVIVATALLSDGVLVTADRRLRAVSDLRVVW